MTEKTAEELEAETAEIEKRLATLRAKNKKVAPPPIKRMRREGDILRDIQSDQRIKGRSATLSNSHSVPAGPTLINLIEAQMDKRRKVMEDMVIKHGMEQCLKNAAYLANKGRYEGFAASLGILRSTGLSAEIVRSNQRLKIGEDE